MGSKFVLEDYDASIPMHETLITNRSFLYGEGSTTCTLLRPQGPLFWKDHLCRLIESWRCYYPKFNQIFLKSRLNQLLKKIPFSSENRYLKIHLFCNDKERTFSRRSQNIQPNIILYGDVYKERKELFQMITKKNENTISSRSKIPFYLNQINDIELYKKDILYYDFKGDILEGAFCNVFFIFGENLVTPEGTNIIQGVCRKNLIKCFKEVKIRKVHYSELSSVDEVFMVNSLMLIKSVLKINKKKLCDKITRKLEKRFLQWIG